MASMTPARRARPVAVACALAISPAHAIASSGCMYMTVTTPLESATAHWTASTRVARRCGRSAFPTLTMSGMIPRSATIVPKSGNRLGRATGYFRLSRSAKRSAIQPMGDNTIGKAGVYG